MRKALLFVGACAIACGDLLADDEDDKKPTAPALADGGPGATDGSGGAPGTQSYRDMIFADGPIAYFPCDDLQTSTALVDVVAGRNAAHACGIGACALEREGIAGTAIHMNGAGEGLIVQNPFFLGGSFTIELWFRAANARGQFAQALFRNDGVDDGSSPVISISVGDGLIYVTRSGRDSQTSPIQSDLPKVGFVHLVATFNGKALTVYTNGMSSGIGSSADEILELKTTPRLVFANGKENPFEGDLDEIAIYDRALSEADVQRHHSNRR